MSQQLIELILLLIKLILAMLSSLTTGDIAV